MKIHPGNPSSVWLSCRRVLFVFPWVDIFQLFFLSVLRCRQGIEAFLEKSAWGMLMNVDQWRVQLAADSTARKLFVGEKLFPSTLRWQGCPRSVKINFCSLSSFLLAAMIIPSRQLYANWHMRLCNLRLEIRWDFSLIGSHGLHRVSGMSGYGDIKSTLESSKSPLVNFLSVN